MKKTKKTTSSKKSAITLKKALKESMAKKKAGKLLVEAKEAFPIGTLRAYGKDKNYLYVKVGDTAKTPWAYYAPIDSAKGKEAIKAGAVVIVDGKAMGPATDENLAKFGVEHPFKGQVIPNLVPGHVLGSGSKHVTPSTGGPEEEKPSKAKKKAKEPTPLAPTPAPAPTVSVPTTQVEPKQVASSPTPDPVSSEIDQHYDTAEQGLMKALGGKILVTDDALVEPEKYKKAFGSVVDFVQGKTTKNQAVDALLDISFGNVPGVKLSAALVAVKNAYETGVPAIGEIAEPVSAFVKAKLPPPATKVKVEVAVLPAAQQAVVKHLFGDKEHVGEDEVGILNKVLKYINDPSEYGNFSDASDLANDYQAVGGELSKHAFYSAITAARSALLQGLKDPNIPTNLYGLAKAFQNLGTPKKEEPPQVFTSGLGTFPDPTKIDIFDALGKAIGTKPAAEILDYLSKEGYHSNAKEIVAALGWISKYPGTIGAMTKIGGEGADNIKFKLLYEINKTYPGTVDKLRAAFGGTFDDSVHLANQPGDLGEKLKKAMLASNLGGLLIPEIEEVDPTPQELELAKLNKAKQDLILNVGITPSKVDEILDYLKADFGAPAPASGGGLYAPNMVGNAKKHLLAGTEPEYPFEKKIVALGKAAGISPTPPPEMPKAPSTSEGEPVPPKPEIPFPGVAAIAYNIKLWAAGTGGIMAQEAIQKAQEIVGFPIGGLTKALSNAGWDADKAIADIKKSGPFTKSMVNLAGVDWEEKVKKYAVSLGGSGSAGTSSTTTTSPAADTHAPTSASEIKTKLKAPVNGGSWVSAAKISAIPDGVNKLGTLANAYKKTYSELDGAGIGLSQLSEMHDFIKGVTPNPPEWCSPELANGLVFLRNLKAPAGMLGHLTASNALASYPLIALALSMNILDQAHPEKATGPLTPKAEAPAPTPEELKHKKFVPTNHTAATIPTPSTKNGLKAFLDEYGTHTKQNLANIVNYVTDGKDPSIPPPDGVVTWMGAKYLDYVHKLKKLFVSGESFSLPSDSSEFPNDLKKAIGVLLGVDLEHESTPTQKKYPVGSTWASSDYPGATATVEKHWPNGNLLVSYTKPDGTTWKHNLTPDTGLNELKPQATEAPTTEAPTSAPKTGAYSSAKEYADIKNIFFTDGVEDEDVADALNDFEAYITSAGAPGNFTSPEAEAVVAKHKAALAGMIHSVMGVHLNMAKTAFNLGKNTTNNSATDKILDLVKGSTEKTLKATKGTPKFTAQSLSSDTPEIDNLLGDFYKGELVDENGDSYNSSWGPGKTATVKLDKIAQILNFITDKDNQESAQSIAGGGLSDWKAIDIAKKAFWSGDTSSVGEGKGYWSTKWLDALKALNVSPDSLANSGTWTAPANPLDAVPTEIENTAAAVGDNPDNVLTLANYLAKKLAKGQTELSVPPSIQGEIPNSTTSAMLAMAKHLANGGDVNATHLSPEGKAAAKLLTVMKKHFEATTKPKMTVSIPSLDQVKDAMKDPFIEKLASEAFSYWSSGTDKTEAVHNTLKYLYNGEPVATYYHEESPKAKEYGQLIWGHGEALAYKNLILSPDHASDITNDRVKFLGALLNKLGLPVTIAVTEEEQAELQHVPMPGYGSPYGGLVSGYKNAGWGFKSLSTGTIKNLIPHVVSILKTKSEAEIKAKIEGATKGVWGTKEKKAVEAIIAQAQKTMSMVKAKTPEELEAKVAAYSKKTPLPKGADYLAKMLTLAANEGYGTGDKDPFSEKKVKVTKVHKKKDIPNYVEELAGPTIADLPMPKGVKAKAPSKSAVGFVASAYSGFGENIQGSKWKMSDLKQTASAISGGAGKKQTLADPEGKKYIFKFATKKGSDKKEEFRAHAQAAASSIAQAIKSHTPKISPVMYNGSPGVIYPFVEASGNLSGVSPTSLSQDEALGVAEEHLIDWITGQHDSHGGNLLRTPNGIIGIDKEQAYKYFGEDKLSVDYAPNTDAGEDEPYYNKFWRSWAEGSVDFDPQKLAPAFDRLSKMSVTYFQDAVAAYATAKYGKKNLELAQFVGRVKTRRNQAKRDFEKFITDLYKKRTGEEGTFTFKGGWKTKGGKTFKKVTGAQHSALAGANIVDFKSPTGPDSSKKTFKISASKDKSILENLLKELNLEALSPIKTGSNYHSVVVDAKKLDDSHITTEVPEQASTNIPPYSGPEYLNSAKYYESTKRDNSFLDEVPHQKLPRAVPIAAGGTLVENQTLRLSKRKDSSGKEYYQVVFKLREEGDKVFSGGGTTVSEGFPLASFDDKQGLYVESGSYTFNRPVKKTTLANGSSVTFDHDGSGGFAHHRLVHARIYLEKGQGLRDQLREALVKHTGNPAVVDRILAPPTENEKQILKLSAMINAFAPDKASSLPQEGKRNVDSLKNILYAAGITDEDIDSVHEVEVTPGYTTHVMPGLWRKAAMLKDGTPGVTQLRVEVDTAEKVLNIASPTGGYKGINERLWDGVPFGGASAPEDVKTGCSDACTVRVDGGISEYTWHSWGKYAIIAAPDIFDRLDTHLAWFDSFGAYTGGKSSAYKSRKPIQEQLKRNATSEPCTEGVVRRGFAADKIIRISCLDESYRKILIQAYKDRGITEVNGIPVEDFVVTHNSSNKDMYDNFISPSGYQ